MTAKDLIRDLYRKINSGEITPDTPVIIGHHTKGPEGLIEDLYYWGLETFHDENGVLKLEVEAYNEPLD